MDENDIIKVDNVSFGYYNNPVLEHITLDIQKSDFVGFIGPNGSGKSTLLKIIIGLIKPQSGKVTLFGEPVDQFKDWVKIGYVPQKAGQISIQFPLTVEEVVEMDGGSKHAVEVALKHVEMFSVRKKLITELSGGQQQRVFIARALVHNPELLILDEPTVGVDAESQTRFYGLLKELNQEHKITLVLVSHDIDVVAHEVKTIMCINKSLVCHGKPADILKGNFLEEMYGKNLKFVVHGH